MPVDRHERRASACDLGLKETFHQIAALILSGPLVTTCDRYLHVFTDTVTGDCNIFI